MRVSLEKNGPLPFPLPALGDAQAAKLCKGISQGNTGTSGVLEQRLTDCWLLHTAGDLAKWHSKGFGDSVFATNTSRKKFGDAEIKHRDLAEIISVEAHGGHLSQVYVDDHLATLMRVLLVRIEELEDRVPVSDWKLILRFVSHSVDADLLESTVVGGLPVQIEYYNFADIAPLGADAAFQALLHHHFVEQLNVVHVPAKFRQSALKLL
jgi:hypothetical protein